MNNNKPTLGFALSGSGNRTSFYIGFLERLSEAGIKPDYISAMSGASLISASYACGTLSAFKEAMLSYEAADIRKFISKTSDSGGLYSLELVELELRTKYTKGFTFEEVRPLMSFLTADIESGEEVDLCMGDIAKAACASCTLPGIFKPVIWGHRVLVDGGILSQVPVENLKKFNPDIIIGVNMRGTKNVFPKGLITFRRMINFFKKALYFEEMEKFFDELLNYDSEPAHKSMRSFTVLGKSLDVVINSVKKENKKTESKVDLMIVPEKKYSPRSEFSKEMINHYYKEGREVAEQCIPKIQELIKQKEKVYA